MDQSSHRTNLCHYSIPHQHTSSHLERNMTVISKLEAQYSQIQQRRWALDVTGVCFSSTKEMIQILWSVSNVSLNVHETLLALQCFTVRLNCVSCRRQTLTSYPKAILDVFQVSLLPKAISEWMLSSSALPYDHPATCRYLHTLAHEIYQRCKLLADVDPVLSRESFASYTENTITDDISFISQSSSRRWSERIGSDDLSL